MRAGRIGLWLAICVVGCVSTDNRPVVELPTIHSDVRDQLVLHSDFRLPHHHRLIDELIAQRRDVAERLQVPVSDEPIHIFLFEDPTRYRDYVGRNYPQLVDRRAFFVENDTQLAVYAHWGDHVAEDLRHEVAHGYMHSVITGIPLWLDEGLAEYFEVSRGRRGLNSAHVTLLSDRYQRYQWRPQLERLQPLQQAADMKQVDYAEAWLWVHFLLETTEPRRALLQNYLARLRMTGEAPPLVGFLRETEPQYEAEVLEHLRRQMDEVNLIREQR